jgi:hypothetical protein
MLCPKCQFGNKEDDLYCRRCGADLTVPSTSLVPMQDRTLTLFHHPQLPRFAAGVGAVAFGVGIELVRRGLLARAMSPRSVSNTLPTLNRLRDVLFPQNDKRFKLPKNYEIEETVVYMRRVIRRK